MMKWKEQLNGDCPSAMHTACTSAAICYVLTCPRLYDNSPRVPNLMVTQQAAQLSLQAFSLSVVATRRRYPTTSAPSAAPR
jgi:hypothetical protein